MNKIFLLIIMSSIAFAYSDESFDIADEYAQLEQEYYRLNNIFLDGEWEFVEKGIEEVNYKQRLQKLLKTELPSDFDPEGNKKRRLEQLSDTLNIWLTYINDTCPGVPIWDIICSATEKVDEVENLYYKAKKANSEELLVKACAKVLYCSCCLCENHFSSPGTLCIHLLSTGFS